MLSYAFFIIIIISIPYSSSNQTWPYACHTRPGQQPRAREAASPQKSSLEIKSV